MTAIPHVALLMQRAPAARKETAARLRDLGFAVSEFADEAHLYGRTILAAPDDHASFVILTEATEDVVHDLEVLRSGHWTTPLVLLGCTAEPALARRLCAACLPSERPTASELRRAIEVAVTAAARHAPRAVGGAS
jgi:hypothetical protein